MRSGAGLGVRAPPEPGAPGRDAATGGPMPIRSRLSAAALCVLAAGSAHAQLFTATVTDGGLEFDLATQAPFPNMGPALLRPSNLVSAAEPDVSQVNQYLWYYFLPGDARAYNFNSEGGQEV